MIKKRDNIYNNFIGDYAVIEETIDENNNIIIKIEDMINNQYYYITLDTNNNITIPEGANKLEVYLALAEEFDDVYVYRLASKNYDLEVIGEFYRRISSFFNTIPNEYKRLNKILHFCNDDYKNLGNALLLLKNNNAYNIELLKKLIYERLINVIKNNPFVIGTIPKEFIDYNMIILAARNNIRIFDILANRCSTLDNLSFNIICAYDELVMSNQDINYRNPKLEELLTNPDCLIDIREALENEQKEIQIQLDYLEQISLLQKKNQSYHL